MKIILGPKHKEKEFNFQLENFLGGLTYRGILGKFKHFGVYTSGGLDSTIMLCVLLTELKNINRLKDIEITCFTVCKTSGSTYYADRIIKLVSRIFQKELHHITNIDNPFLTITPTPLTGSTLQEISDNHKGMIFFTGANAYPEEKLEIFKNKEFNTYDNRIMELMRITNPFSNLFKYHILDLYFKLGVEELIPYTHSCTKDPIGSCNNCTGCEERSWAFNTLEKIDLTPIPPNIEDISFNNTWKFSSSPDIIIRNNSSVGREKD